MKAYKDFYGATAYIRTAKSGAARLTVYIHGKLTYAKDYKTERGARIAMGKMGDCWRSITE